MREIKFKAWDKELTKMFELDALFFKKDGGIASLVKRLGGKSGVEYTSCQANLKHRYEVMQYTGLKDKNGKEIFEGDILKAEDGWQGQVISTQDEYPYTSTVTGFRCRGSGLELRITGWSDSEVIGNIYENKELLNKN